MSGFDPIASAIDAAARGSAIAPAMAFAAGAATSIGPCVASRTVAAAALAGGCCFGRWRVPLIMTIGTMMTEVALGLGFGAVARAIEHDREIYAALAAAFCIAGLFVLLRKDECCAIQRPRIGAGGGAAFFTGAGLALAISPCCAPVIASIGMLSLARGGSALVAAASLCAFSVGHALPMLCTGLTFGRASLPARLKRFQELAPTVSAAMLVASGLYYGLLA
jgi:cytochrome c biogenesis protein CcdA